MKTIKVSKEKLFAKLHENREEHRQVFLRAQKGFRAEVIEQLDKALKDAREGKRFQTSFQLPAPVDQTPEYDVAIDMCGWEIDKEIELSQEEFRQYVLDDWVWKDNWLYSNTMYLARKD